MTACPCCTDATVQPGSKHLSQLCDRCHQHVVKLQRCWHEETDD